MNHADRQLLTYGIAGSLAVHLVLMVILTVSISYSALSKMSNKPVDPEPQVTLIYPESVEAAPAPEPPPQPAPQSEAPKPKPKAAPAQYIRTTQNEEAASAPLKVDFQSDRNTIASSKNAPAPNGDKPLPTMEGVKQPTMELADRSFKNGEIKEDSAPSAPPTPPPPPPPVVKPAPQVKPQPPKEAAPTPPIPPKPPEPKETKEPLVAKKTDAPAEKMLKDAASVLDGEKAPLSRPPEPKTEPKAEPKSEPPPEPKPEVQMREPAPQMKAPTEELIVPKAVPIAQPVVNQTRKPVKEAFMPQTQRASVRGTISNRGGEDAVNAAATPSGRYMRQVTSAIEQRWHIHRQEKADFVEPGKMRLHFYVNKNGKPENIKFVFNEANAVLTDFTLSSILEARIPPIPRDLLSMLDNERFEIEYDIVIY